MDPFRSKSIFILWPEVNLPQFPCVVPSTTFIGAKPSRIAEHPVDGESILDEDENDSATKMDEDESLKAYE